MNIIKIVVGGDLPIRCAVCKIPFSLCTNITVNRTALLEMDTRPSWCPLVVEDVEVCEWKHEPMFSEVFFRNPHYHERKDFSVIPTIIQRNYYEFCPHCGKRIKYVEVE